MASHETLGLWALQLVGIVLSALIGQRTWTAYRIAGAPTLRRFALGFWLLAVSLVIVALLELRIETSPDVLDRASLDALDIAFWSYYAATLGGFAAVFASFGRKPFQWAPVLAPVLLWAGWVLQALTVIVLFFVVLHAGLNHIARKGPGSLQASVGFFLLFLAHILNVYNYTPLSPRWVAAEAVHTIGLAVIAASVFRVKPHA